MRGLFVFVKIRRVLRASLTRIFSERFDIYSNRHFYQNASYPIAIYKQLLDAVRKMDSCAFEDFSSSKIIEDKITVFFRHDIDTINCLKNMPLLLDIDIQEKVASPCFLRVDEEEYSLYDANKLVQKYVERGVEFGLHTVCYIDDNYLKAFEDETNKFINAFGFQPKTFTVHGLGQYRSDVRAQFYSDISTRLNEFGYEFSDCCANLRTYHYVIEDCHWNAKNQCRFIYDDFKKLPRNIKRGMNVLILTHPCYWKE